MLTKDNNLYILTQPELYIFITKNLGKIIFCCFLLMIITVIAYHKDLEQVSRLLHIIIIIGLLGLILDRFLRKVAYKIIIDFQKSSIGFYMCRTGEVNEYGFDVIEDISINMYAKFFLESKKILFTVGNNKEFKHVINRLKAQSGMVS